MDVIRHKDTNETTIMLTSRELNLVAAAMYRAVHGGPLFYDVDNERQFRDELRPLYDRILQSRVT